MPIKEAEPTTPLSVRIPVALRDKLDEIARKECRSLAQQLIYFAAIGLESYEGRQKKALKAKK